jgi:hypothetical protein
MMPYGRIGLDGEPEYGYYCPCWSADNGPAAREESAREESARADFVTFPPKNRGFTARVRRSDLELGPVFCPSVVRVWGPTMALLLWAK